MSATAERMPTISPLLHWGFRRYVTRYLRKHFNAVRMTRGTAPRFEPDEAVICFANHPSWWDPLLACFLNERFFDRRRAYSPIDGRALAKYPLFSKLGYYGIQMDSLEGARRFLSVSRRIMRQPNSAIWMTPGGDFCDVRRPTQFQPGLGHLVASLDQVTMVPLALEYTFWQERTPEALVQFGEPLRCRGNERTKEEWQCLLETRLAEAQASLAEIATHQAVDRLETLLDGSAGIGGSYDLFRKLKASLGGRSFESRHSPASSH